MKMDKQVHAIAHPSLALIKYWGKLHSRHPNIPATTSIAVTLDNVTSSVKIQSAQANKFYLDEEIQGFEQITLFQNIFQALYQKKFKKKLDIEPIEIVAHNDFPTASGLASSSSGYAALVKGLDEFYKLRLSNKELSRIARIGSGSASRAIYSGFTIWKRGKQYAEELHYDAYWSDLRVVILAPYTEKKSTPSREGMIHTSKSSPYYPQWVEYSKELSKEALLAIKNKDIEKLGELIQRSYTAMHASAIASYPCVRYWRSKSVELLEYIDEIRHKGIPVWETMDAGPQIKLITTAAYTQEILDAVTTAFPSIWSRVCGIGQGAMIEQ